MQPLETSFLHFTPHDALQYIQVAVCTSSGFSRIAEYAGGGCTIVYCTVLFLGELCLRRVAGLGGQETGPSSSLRVPYIPGNDGENGYDPIHQLTLLPQVLIMPQALFSNSDIPTSSFSAAFLCGCYLSLRRLYKVSHTTATLLTQHASWQVPFPPQTF